MEDKGLIFFGTLGLLTFNILIIIIGYAAFRDLKIGWAFTITIPFVAAAIYFDYLVIGYFINKFKKYKNKKNHE